MRILIVIVSLVLFSSSTSAQRLGNDLDEKYKRDKARFNAFEQEHRRSVSTKNHTVSFLKWGDLTDRVFIWLPGSLLSAYDFYPFAHALVQGGYSVLSIDHYGHGLTKVPANDLDFWDFADDLAAIMDSLSIKRAVIGGFSRGGYLATAFYDKYPERVCGLVLEEGGTVPFRSLFDRMDPLQLSSFYHSIKPPPEIQNLLFDIYPSEFDIYKNVSVLAGADQQWQIFGFTKQKGDRWLLYHGLNEFMNMQDSVHYAQVLNASVEVSRYASSIIRVDPIKSYRSLHVPMLILEAAGSNNVFDGREGNQKLKDMHPHLIHYRVFDCADHNIHFSCPEEFSEELKGFLSLVKKIQ